jgi:FKBP-type peptidyl-prolyl cis-trans isomerase 2
MTVGKGDTIKVNYTGRLESGEVFDTSHPEIARNESVPKVSWFNERTFYEPMEFTAGSGMMIEGFDEAVVGMKINETKEVEIPVEKGYGIRDSSLVQSLPITREVQETMQIKRYHELTPEEFRRNFGSVNITQGQTFNVPGTDFNASILYTAGNRAVVEMLPKHGEVVRIYEYPWNSTVVLVSPGSLILKHNIKSGDVIQFPGMPWNSTVL